MLLSPLQLSPSDPHAAVVEVPIVGNKLQLFVNDRLFRIRSYIWRMCEMLPTHQEDAGLAHPIPSGWDGSRL